MNETVARSPFRVVATVTGYPIEYIELEGKGITEWNKEAMAALLRNIGGDWVGSRASKYATINRFLARNQVGRFVLMTTEGVFASVVDGILKGQVSDEDMVAFFFKQRTTAPNRKKQKSA
jgi:hypothetical protein